MCLLGLAILCNAAAFIGADEAEATELITTYEQNVATFGRFSVEVTCTREYTPEYKEHLKRKLEVAIARKGEITLAEIGVAEIEKQAAAQRVSVEAMRMRLVQDMLDLMKSQNETIIGDGKVEERRAYTVLPEVTEVRLWLERDDPRKISAEERRIPSKTGGNWILAQRKASESQWTQLEPYPYVNKTIAVAWHSTELHHHTSVVPPFIDPRGFQGGDQLLLSQITDRQPGLRVFPNWQVGQATMQLLARKVGDHQFWLCALNSSNGAVPRWTSLCDLSDAQFDLLELATVHKIADQIEELKNHWSVSPIEAACPSQVVYFDSISKVKNAGWYPHVMTLLTLDNVRTADTPQSANIDELPIGWATRSVVTVTEIAANEDGQDIIPLELPNGTALVDSDTQKAVLLGESAEFKVKELVGPPRTPKSWLAIIAANAVLVAIIAAVYIGKPRIIR